jgi:antitoxin ParD1/3/4
MSKLERITVTLSSEMATALRDRVAEGEYATASEIVREALREWSRRRDREQRDLHALRDLIREGDESGPGIPAEKVFTELRQLIAERRAKQA